MSPDRILANYRRLMATGRTDTVIIRRYSGKGASRTVVAEATAFAKVSTYTREELVGNVIQGDRKAIVLNDPAASVPDGKVALSTLLPLSKFTDALVIGGVEISIEGIDDNTRRIQGVLIALELQVRG